jgi:prevent-host-death family protein
VSGVRRAVGVRELRDAVSAVVRDAEAGGQVIVMRRGRPAAVLVSPEWYERACAALGEPWERWGR